MRAVILAAALLAGPAAAAPAFDCARWQEDTSHYITLAEALGRQSSQQSDAGRHIEARELMARQGLVLRLIRQREELVAGRCIKGVP